jgi:hypothetical protein
MKQCSICSGPPEILSAVNSMLKQKLSMKKIAAASGISKASIGRHSLKCCNRKIVDKFKSIKQLIPIVCWPDGRNHRLFHDERMLTVAEVNKLPDSDYILWEVRYSGLSDEAAANVASIQAREQEIRDTLAARDAGLLEEIPVGEMLPPRETEESPSDEEMFFTRAEEPEPPAELKPESPAQGMADLVASVKSMITRRRCG